MSAGKGLAVLATVVLICVLSVPNLVRSDCGSSVGPFYNETPGEVSFTHSGTPRASYVVTREGGSKISTLTLSPPCDFSSNLDATDDFALSAFILTEGSLPPGYNFIGGGRFWGPPIDSTCQGPWGSVFKARDSDGAHGPPSTAILRCEDASNEPPSRPSLESGDTSQTSPCEFDLRVRSSDPDGSVMSYRLEGNVPDGYSIDRSGRINGGPLNVSCGAVAGVGVCRRVWNITVRAKDNDCSLGRELELALRCRGAGAVALE